MSIKQKDNNMTNNDNNYKQVPDKQTRWLLNLGDMVEDISKAIAQDVINHNYQIESKGEYVRNEIIGPWIMFRNELERMEIEPPLLSDIFNVLTSDSILFHKVISLARELHLPAEEEMAKEEF